MRRGVLSIESRFAAAVGPPSAPEPLPGRIEERLGGDLASDPLAEDLDLDALVGHGLRRRHVGVGDRAADGVAVAAARDAADEFAADPNRLRAECDGTRIGKDEAGEAALRLLRGEEGVAPDEVALVELDGEPDPALVRRVLGRDVGAPDAVALLQPQRVDRLVAAGDEAVRPARLPERVPQPQAELGRAV